MNFIKTSAYTSISTTVSLIVSLITNKIAAIYLGTNGLFLLGQLKDFVKLVNVTSSLGTTNGTIKHIAEFKDDTIQFKKFLGTGFRIHLFISIIIFVLILVFNKWLSQYLFNDSKYNRFLIVLGFSLISASIHTLLMSILNGLKHIKLYVTINIVNSIFSGIILIYLILELKIIGAFYAFAINQLLLFIVSFGMILYLKPFNIKFLWSSFSLIAFKKLFKFSLMALAGTICLISATLFVRYFLSIEFDENHAGSWEAMWRISGIYLLFLTSTFSFYLLPTFSNLHGNNLKKEVFKIWKTILPVLIVLGTIVFLIKDWLIVLLFSEKFLLISSLIIFHILGDTLKINCWVLGNILISKAKTSIFILFQIEWALIFCISTYFLVKAFGFSGVAMAYFLAYVVHFILLNVYFKDLLWMSSKTSDF